MPGPDSPSVPRRSSAGRPEPHQPTGGKRQEDHGQQQEEVQGRVWRRGRCRASPCAATWRLQRHLLGQRGRSLQDRYALTNKPAHRSANHQVFLSEAASLSSLPRRLHCERQHAPVLALLFVRHHHCVTAWPPYGARSRWRIPPRLWLPLLHRSAGGGPGRCLTHAELGACVGKNTHGTLLWSGSCCWYSM